MSVLKIIKILIILSMIVFSLGCRMCLSEAAWLENNDNSFEGYNEQCGASSTCDDSFCCT